MKLIAFLIASISLLPLATADVSILDNHETLTVDCAEDPNVSIMGNHATVKLSGTCTNVSVFGNHATITGSAAAVSIAGNHNTATLDAIDALSITGNENTATYKKPINTKLKKPKTSNLGHNNTITQTK